MMSPLAQAAERAGVADLLPSWAGQTAPLVTQRSAAELMAFLVDDVDRVVSQMERLSRC